MDPTIEEIFNKINFLEKELTNNKMVITMLESGIKMSLMDLVDNNSQMEIATKDNLLMVLKKVKEHIGGRITLNLSNIQDNFKMIK